MKDKAIGNSHWSPPRGKNVQFIASRLPLVLQISDRLRFIQYNEFVDCV